MFVKAGAHQRLVAQRKEAFYQAYVASLVAEAKKLGIEEAHLLELIKRGSDHE